jgi:hypothetical protein
MRHAQAFSILVKNRGLSALSVAGEYSGVMGVGSDNEQPTDNERHSFGKSTAAGG